jgi:hypothetical protein
MSNLVASDSLAGVSLDLWDSQRLILGNDACSDDNLICMEDILQQDCDFLFNLQDDYSRLSLGGSLYGEPGIR